IKIIKKDSINVSVPQNYTVWNGVEQLYYFTNLSTGTYILESTIGCAGYKVYDTVTVRPYVYPLQEQTHITQCGTNSFVFKDSVTGGIAPFTYEVIASVPNIASLQTGPQSSNVFLIPPGANLDTVKMRVMDACGNAHIKNFSVNHLASCLPLETLEDNNVPQIQNKKISVFPNPSHKQFTIAFSQKQRKNYRISVFNAIGIQLLNKKVENIDSGEIVINANLSPGTYIIEIVEEKINKAQYFKQVIY
ncbi:MAG: T9SS type A sorting domain-containing protein, partial [Flavobacterium sp.]